TEDVFHLGDSITLCIDEVRFLPHNASVCKISGRLFDHNFKVLHGTSDISAVPDLDSPLLSPKFSFQTTIRCSNFPKTSVLMLKLYTIDTISLSLHLIGTTLIELFHSTATGMQPEEILSLNSDNYKYSDEENKIRYSSPRNMKYESEQDEVILNQGAHQLSWSVGAPDVRMQLTSSSMLGFNTYP
ncbi:Coiled-coil domain-containing protein 17, partial [Nowakowskiella sp. JEL0078]